MKELVIMVLRFMKVDALLIHDLVTKITALRLENDCNSTLYKAEREKNRQLEEQVAKLQRGQKWGVADELNMLGHKQKLEDGRRMAFLDKSEELPLRLRKSLCEWLFSPDTTALLGKCLKTDGAVYASLTYSDENGIRAHAESVSHRVSQPKPVADYLGTSPITVG